MSDLTPLYSTDLSGFSYDAKKQSLILEFRSGGLYRYGAVPQDVVDGLVDAPSKGKYFHSNIKNQYETEKIS